MAHLDRLTALAGLAVVVGCVAVGLGLDPPDENRALKELPPVDDALLLEGDALAQTADALEDRSGLRSLGVQADGWFRQQVVGERIFDQYVRGDDGWLYLRQTVEGACDRPPMAPAIGQVAERAAAVGAAADVQVIVVVPPDKAAVHLEHLGPFAGAGACLAEQARGLAALPPPVVGPYDEVVAVRDASTDPHDTAYYPEDTHWRHGSGVAASRPVYELAAPELVDQLVVEQDGVLTPEMDLARFSGRVVTVEEPVLALRPAGATIVDRSAGDDGVERLRSAGATVPDRHVVFVRDSFGQYLLPSFAHLGTSMAVCNCQGRLDARMGPDLETAELLVLQVVQRNAVGMLVSGDAAGQLAALLGDRLPSRELEVAADGTVELPQRGLLRFTFDGTPEEVAVVSADGARRRALTVRRGVVSALFVEDLDAARVRVETDGPPLVRVEAIDLG